MDDKRGSLVLGPAGWFQKTAILEAAMVDEEAPTLPSWPVEKIGDRVLFLCENPDPLSRT